MGCMPCGHPQLISGLGSLLCDVPLSHSPHVSCHSQLSTVKSGKNNLQGEKEKSRESKAYLRLKWASSDFSFAPDDVNTHWWRHEIMMDYISTLVMHKANIGKMWCLCYEFPEGRIFNSTHPDSYPEGWGDLNTLLERLVDSYSVVHGF